jgi:hypothetical protein
VSGTGKRLTDDRQARYGSPEQNWTRAAALYSAVLGDKLREPITPAEVGLLAMAWKVSRLCASPNDRDSLEDLAGYAAAMQLLHGETPTV